MLNSNPTTLDLPANEQPETQHFLEMSTVEKTQGGSRDSGLTTPTQLLTDKIQAQPAARLGWAEPTSPGGPDPSWKLSH